MSALRAGANAADDARYRQPSWSMPDLNDYVKRVVMIPMRDGVKLYTVIVVPKGAKRAPIMLTRTPYNAARRAQRATSPSMLATLPQGDDTLVENGYIRVFQDVRGKYGSEGDYVMTRPVRGPLNNTKVDNVTDAWDTIAWLVEEHSRVQRQGRHARLVLRRPYGADGAGRPAPGTEGGDPDERHGRRLARRRLVSQRRFPHAQPVLPGRPDQRARQRRIAGAGRLRRLRRLSAHRLGRRFRQEIRHRQADLHQKTVRAPGLRQLLAGAGARQDPRQTALDRADHACGGAVGPGRYLRRLRHLCGDGRQGQAQQPELPGRRPMAPQRRQL